MGVVPGQIHVMSRIDGVTWDEVWHSREAGAPRIPHGVVHRSDAFLRNKRAAGRPKDLADLDALRDSDR